MKVFCPECGAEYRKAIKMCASCGFDSRQYDEEVWLVTKEPEPPRLLDPDLAYVDALKDQSKLRSIAGNKGERDIGRIAAIMKIYFNRTLIDLAGDKNNSDEIRLAAAERLKQAKWWWWFHDY